MTRLSSIPFRHFKIVWGVVILISLLGAFGVSRVTWEQDITSLLPKKDDSLISLAREWGMMKTVTVAIGPASSDDAALHDAMDSLMSRLQSLPGTAAVTGRVSTEKAMETVVTLSSHAAALYRPTREETLTPERISLRLEAVKNRLAAPEAMMTGAYLLNDPLGFAQSALAGLEAAATAMGAVVERGHLLSSDHRFGLILLSLDFDPMDVRRAGAYVNDLDRVLASVSNASGLPVFALGGVHHATATARVMMRDITKAFVLTVLLVLAVFLIFFRSLRMLPSALLPSVVGILCALGVMGFLNIPVHAVTIGFAATICGISIDYVIHLLYRAGIREGTTEAAMARAFGDVIRPVTLGFLTTQGAFAIIASSGFVGIRQMAVFSLISLPVAFFVALFATPSLHRFLLVEKRHAVGRESRLFRWISKIFSASARLNRYWVGGIFALLLSGSVAAALKIEFSGDPRDLGNVDSALAAREQILRSAFPGIFEQAMIVSSGKNEETALQRNDALYDALIGAGTPRSDIVSFSPFLPSRATQEAGVDAVRKILEGADTRAAFVNAGFKDGYLDSLLAKSANAERSPLLPDNFKNTGLAELLDKSLHTDGRGTIHCLTRVRIRDDAAIGRLADIAARAGARLVSERLETKEVLLQLQKEIVIMLIVWLIAAVAGVSLAQRSLLFGLRAALPALFGVAAAAAVFSLTGRPLTAVASAGITLVLGLSVDYGIFMQSTCGHRAETAGATAASALTTIAGFGVLAFTAVRAMADIGLIILIGISVAVVTALVLVPCLMPAVRSKNVEP